MAPRFSSVKSRRAAAWFFHRCSFLRFSWSPSPVNPPCLFRPLILQNLYHFMFWSAYLLRIFSISIHSSMAAFPKPKSFCLKASMALRSHEIKSKWFSSSVQKFRTSNNLAQTLSLLLISCRSLPHAALALRCLALPYLHHCSRCPFTWEIPSPSTTS